MELKVRNCWGNSKERNPKLLPIGDGFGFLLFNEYKEGTEITEPGKYTVKITDTLDNVSERSFIIVTPVSTGFSYSFDETAGFEKVIINGEETRLAYGALELTEDGTYKIVLEDGVGNVSEYSFEILWKMPAAAIVLIVVAALGTVGAVVWIIISKKRKDEYYN